MAEEPLVRLVRSKQRVADHGEVFTPAWMVDAMLDLVGDESSRIDSRFLEPACGSGNFLVKVLSRKLSTVAAKHGRNAFERRHHALLAVMCTYGIELLDDNVAECRANLLEVLAAFVSVDEAEVVTAARHVLELNIVHGDALSMLTAAGEAMAFPEWSYLGRGRFQRRDFRFDTMTRLGSFAEEDTLFGDLGRHEIFTPARAYPPATVADLAALAA